MSRKVKNGVLGPFASTCNTVEPAPVEETGNGKNGSPLDEYKWKPGQSGNPSGKSKLGDLKAEVRAFAEEADPKTQKTRLRVWMEMADRRARQGSPKHLELLLAYGWGKPSQAIEVDADLSYHDILTSVRRKRELAEADQTIRHYFGSLASAGASGNGHSAAQMVIPEQDLSAAREDDAEEQIAVGNADDIARSLVGQEAEPVDARKARQKVTVEL
jgi:hypothetical protein